MSGLEFTSVPHQRTFLKQLNTSVAFPFTGALPPPSQPPLPSSTFSITGNNRPPSFITSWRWFPHGATRSLCCQPASQPAHSQSTAELRENKESVSASSFPYRPLRRWGMKGWRGLTLGLSLEVPQINTSGKKPITITKSFNVPLQSSKETKW